MAATPQATQVASDDEARVMPIRGRRRVAQFIALTKPRIIELLLVTTVPVMFAAAQGLPPLGLVGWTVLGGTLAAAGANVFNCLLDADIDVHMQRTALRPTATGEISRAEAAIFGSLLSLASVAVLGIGANWLSAVLAATAIAAYVLGYTVLLKRRTTQNIVWGGIAGCFPVIIGWTAVAGRPSLAAWLLFALVFFWTPAHYWPLSMKYGEDYRNAHVPMLGAVAPAQSVSRSILLYTAATILTAVAYGVVAQTGIVFWIVSSAAAAWFVVQAIVLRRISASGVDQDAVLGQAMRVFHVSISYLALVFLAVGVDPLITS